MGKGRRKSSGKGVFVLGFVPASLIPQTGFDWLNQALVGGVTVNSLFACGVNLHAIYSLVVHLTVIFLDVHAF